MRSHLADKATTSVIAQLRGVSFGRRERALLLAAPLPGVFGRSRKATTGGLIVRGHNIDPHGKIVTEPSRSARVSSLRAARRLFDLDLVEHRRAKHVAIAQTNLGAKVVERYREQLKTGGRIRWRELEPDKRTTRAIDGAKQARLISSDLVGVLELIYIAASPPDAADLVGLDYGDLDDEERRLLQDAEHKALAAGIERVSGDAKRGDREAKRWLRGIGLGEVAVGRGGRGELGVIRTQPGEILIDQL